MPRERRDYAPVKEVKHKPRKRREIIDEVMNQRLVYGKILSDLKCGFVEESERTTPDNTGTNSTVENSQSSHVVLAYENRYFYLRHESFDGVGTELDILVYAAHFHPKEYKPAQARFVFDVSEDGQTLTMRHTKKRPEGLFNTLLNASVDEEGTQRLFDTLQTWEEDEHNDEPPTVLRWVQPKLQT